MAGVDEAWGPWYVVRSDDRKRARLYLITHLLSQVPYKEAPREKVKLPERESKHKYKSPDYPFKYIPEAF